MSTLVIVVIVAVAFLVIISTAAYFRVVDAVKSVIEMEMANVYSAIDQITQTTLRKVVGQHTLDETLSETDVINGGSEPETALEPANSSSSTKPINERTPKGVRR